MRHRSICVALTALFCLLAACGTDDAGEDDDGCEPDDQDGIIGGDATFVLTVDDATFAPAIVTTQNSSVITLTITNRGTRPHGFAIDCLPTPNSRGCPIKACFPAEATAAPIAPGATATVKFTAPAVEGIYTYRSPADGDSAVATGQFILK